MLESPICEGLGFPEGPCFDADETLHVVDVRGGRINQIRDGRANELAAPGGGPNGAAFGYDGALYVANNGGLLWGDDGISHGKGIGNNGGWIDRIDRDGTVVRLYAECDGEPLHACNDIVFDQHGWFYFTDPKHGTREERPPGYVCYAAPDGSSIERVADGFQLSNGIALSEDGSLLFVAESVTRIVWCFDVERPGVVSGKRAFAQLPEGYLPDGLCIDGEGRLIACGITGGALFVFAPDGRLERRLDMGASDTTNAAFGGPDFSTLFVTQGTGKVSTIEWDSPGMKLFPDRPHAPTS